MCLKLNKLEAAYRQLNTAIRLYFMDEDLISVHTLAGASHIILHDLVEDKHPGKSWEKVAAEDNKIDLNEFLRITRRAQNYLKHAKQDPNSVLTLNKTDTEHLLYLNTLNLCALIDKSETLSNEVSVFQSWFTYVYRYQDIEPCLAKCFKDLNDAPKDKQIKLGYQILKELNNNA